MVMENLVVNLAMGLGAALTTSVGTYLAKKEKAEADGEVGDFSIGKFSRTMLAGVISGLTIAMMGEGASIANVAGNLGMVNVLDQGSKFFYRLFLKK